MRIKILPTAERVGAFAARQIHDGVTSGRIRVLGVATGSSPEPVYSALAARGLPRPETLTAFALDEYVGLPASHPQSYRSVIDREVTRPLGLDPSRVHIPDGTAADLELACTQYEGEIAAAGGIDLQLLGIGVDGHLGFNEPTSSLASRTRIKTLTRRTREDNARFFSSLDEVPLHCLTQGLGTILDAREALLVATGETKAPAVAAMVEGPLSAICPASVLQLHPKATVLLDPAAASALRQLDYYEMVEAHLPGWQR